MSPNCLAQRGVRFGRVDDGVEEHVPVSRLDHQAFVPSDEVVCCIERTADHEARYLRIPDRRRALDHALGRRRNANLDPLCPDVLGTRRKIFDLHALLVRDQNADSLPADDNDGQAVATSHHSGLT